MNVLSRNYFRMLRNGAFGDKEPMEPMSKYKWDLLYKRAEEEEVLSYLKDDVPHASINFENHKQTRRFKKIAKAEYHAIDTSLDTLDMLNILLYNIDRTLSGKTSIHGIVEMGRFLRRKGDKVDFVKLESWLHQLRIYNMARLHASVLIALFGFSIEELPFMNKEASKAEQLGQEDQQLTFSYLAYYPVSTTHSMFRRLHHAITEIEE